MSLPESSRFDFRAVLRPGDHIAWPQGTGEPVGLTRALMDQAEALPRVTLVVGMVTSRTMSHPGAERFDYLALNGAGGARRAVALSGGRVIPGHVSQLPALIRARRIPVDVALVRVRPTDDPDMLSLGVMVDIVHELIESARVVVAEFDERMPLTAHDALIPRAAITHLTHADQPEPVIRDPEPTEVDRLVAKNVAGLIPDRATVQFGVGGMPVAVCGALRGHKDLGLHSGVISDVAVDLIEAGVITNRYKGIDVGLTVTGGLFGTKRLNDHADRNPELAMRRATHTHSAAVLSQLQALHSINSAVAIDLSGQVNAEVAGGRYIGAVGGQVDYVRGGRLSPGGRSIMALASTTPDGRHSKIVSSLAGQPVTTARSDIDLVVTEHGVADLWGRDLHARAEALIAIAHPAFRDQLARDFEKTLS